MNSKVGSIIEMSNVFIALIQCNRVLKIILFRNFSAASDKIQNVLSRYSIKINFKFWASSK